MKIIKQNDEKTNVKFEIEVNKEEWKESVEKKRKDLSKDIKIEGFRKGKVPYEIAKKYIDDNAAISRVIDSVINSNIAKLEESKEYKNNNSSILEGSTVNVIKLSKDEFSFECIYDKVPEIELKDYKNIKINEKKPSKSNDKEVDAEIKKMLKYSKNVSDKKDGKLEKGDIAVFDFEGFKDKKAFPGGSAKDFELEIGSNQFIPGFEDKMIGMKLNEEKEIELSFPKDYHEKDLAGKPVMFKVKLNKMKSAKLPKLSEEYVSKQNIEGVKTVEEFKKYISDLLYREQHQQYKEKALKEVVDFLVENSTISHLPNSLIEVQKNQLVSYYEQELKKQNISIDQYLELTNLTKEAFEKQILEEAKKAVTISLVFDKISETEKIKVQEKEIDEYIEKLTKIYGGDSKSIRKMIGNDTSRISEEILQNKIVDFLIK